MPKPRTKRKLTEEQAVKALQDLADRWPDTLWLFNNGDMHVMRLTADGEPAMTRSGGVDSDYCIATIDNLHSEGGGW